MKTIYIPFTNSTFQLIFEDEAFADNAIAVFHTVPTVTNDPDKILEIQGSQGNNYRVYVNGELIREKMSREEAAYCMTTIFGDEICSHIDDSTGILHASSVLIDDFIVSFSGVSGSGKTSLSLIFSRYGNYIGDEYAHVDLNTGHLWHEDHPYQLKERNTAILSTIPLSSRLKVKTDLFGQAWYVSLDTTNYKKVRRDDQVTVKFIVFPHYNKDCQKTMISMLPVMKLPGTILQSLMGQDPPSLVFQKFVHMAALHGIHLVEITFSDGDDAARELMTYITNEINGVLQ
jgi:hypothetical protein